MFRRFTSLVALSLIAAAPVLATTPEPATAAQPPAAPADPARIPNNTNGDGSLKVVVRANAAPAQSGDARIEIGGWRISRPGPLTQPAPAEPASTNAPAPTTRPDGAVLMPDNTFGPGEPMWQIREREAAALKLAKADADLARTDADRARPTYNDFTYARDILAENASFGRFDVGGFGYRGGGGGWGGGWNGHFRGGLRGPVTTTIIHDDQLGSKGQREFSKAAYPKNDGSQDAHDAAVRRFGNDAQPKIKATQGAVDRAHRNANKEHPPLPTQGR